MDANKAINVIEAEVCDNCCGCDTLPNENCAYHLAKDALESKIPKKPLSNGYRYGGIALSGKCSVCNRMVNSRDHNFCHGCGHKLDWSEDNE